MTSSKIDLWTTKSELSHDARLFWRGWNSFDCFQQKNYDLHFWTPSSLTFVITFCMIYHLEWNHAWQQPRQPRTFLYGFPSTQKRSWQIHILWLLMHDKDDALIELFKSIFKRCTFKSLFIWVSKFSKVLLYFQEMRLSSIWMHFCKK